jgi:hypothetical protein
MPALRPAILAALAAAALPATMAMAVPRPMRVIVGDMVVTGTTGQSRESAIRFLKKEMTTFLHDPNGTQGWPPEIYFQPLSGTSPIPDGDLTTLRDRLSREKDDVLAYIWEGSVGPGNSTTPVVEYTIVLRPPGVPQHFVGAKAKFPQGTRQGISYEHKFVIAYALIMRAYQAGDFDVAAALAERVGTFVTAAKNSWGPTVCVADLAEAIRKIGGKARERILAGATDTGGALPRFLPQNVICNPPRR